MEHMLEKQLFGLEEKLSCSNPALKAQDLLDPLLYISLQIATAAVSVTSVHLSMIHTRDSNPRWVLLYMGKMATWASSVQA